MEVHLQVSTSLSEGWSRDDDHFSYGYAGVARLEVGEGITLYQHPELPVEVARLLVLGTGMALFLHRAGRPILHGTTVRLNGYDLMLCGPSGVGKSSVTAALLQKGALLVADDVGVLDEGRVRTGLPRIKLWKDAARWFGYDPSVLARVHPDFAKYSVPVERVQSPAPLRRIVILKRGVAGFRQLRGQEALVELLANHRVPEVLSPAESLAWMEALVALLPTVSVWELRLPGPLDDLMAGVQELIRSVRTHP